MIYMERTTNRILIDQWINLNGPNGISKLAVESKVSDSTISKIRATGEAPKKHSTRAQLCQAMGHAEDELFPPKKIRKKAS